VDRFDSVTIIPGAEVNLFDAEGNKIRNAISNDQGIVHFDLAFDVDYELTAAKEEYSWVDTLAYSTFTRYMGGDSVLIPLWKQSLFAKGKVYSNETQSILPGASVKIDNLTKGTSETVIVDSLGEYSFKLEPNEIYQISSFKAGHLDKSFKLNTKNIFRGELLNDFLLEEVFEEKAVVQFDFDKSVLKPEGINLLKPLLKTLNRKKESTLNIGAHADAYGTHQYNQRLSERRAKSVLDYFVSNGIAKSRIEAVGFGEELLLNNCSAGTDCTEEEHSLNRRAELKVQLPE
jgi:outer membrane protein OmpA-like peptidoglycan-associated protein